MEISIFLKVNSLDKFIGIVFSLFGWIHEIIIDTKNLDLLPHDKSSDNKINVVSSF